MRIKYCSALLLLPILLFCGCKRQQTAGGPGAGGMPPAPVSVAKATQQPAPAELHVVGTVEASAVVQVKSQVAGELVSVAFTEGQNAAKGDLLFRIDPRPFQDALRQAEAAVTRDRAQIAQSKAELARDQAQAKYAEVDANRYAGLVKEGLASQSQYDQSRSAADVARESARATEATIEAANAALAADNAVVAAARLNLSYCEIHAPIGGRTGNLLVHPGNLVKVNDVALVVINQISPIFVDFSAPEQHLDTIRRLSAASRLPIRVFTSDDPNHPSEGRLSVIDNAVDSATGTIHLKGVFDNKDRRLWPGQFVNVSLTLDTIQNATVVPSEAVQAGQQGQFVYVVKPNNTAEMRVISTGRSFGNSTVIDKGVAPGETVVTDGFLRLFPGSPVQVMEPAKVGSL
jgi:multidrug efflux system membrane fusion protein